MRPPGYHLKKCMIIVSYEEKNVESRPLEKLENVPFKSSHKSFLKGMESLPPDLFQKFTFIVPLGKWKYIATAISLYPLNFGSK